MDPKTENRIPITVIQKKSYAKPNKTYAGFVGWNKKKNLIKEVK